MRPAPLLEPISVVGLGLYAAIAWIASPAINVYLRRRAGQGKEESKRLGERWGHAGLVRPPGPLLWLHAASVGEAVSLLPLIDAVRLRWPALSILATTGTRTSAELLASRLPIGATHQYAPIDSPGAVGRFLAHWRPSLAVWVESELWPTTLARLRRAGVPAALLNARISERSYRRWRSILPIARSVLGAFDFVLAQSQADADRFCALGARSVRSVGNLKAAAAPLPFDEGMLQTLAHVLRDRPRWLAASTHAGEEVLAAGTHRDLLARHPRLLTIIVPRHPARGPEIAGLIRAMGIDVSLRSRNQLPEDRTQVYVADTLGELGLWYRLCQIAFLGGSLVPHGGHNFLEPAILSAALVAGPHTHNFRDLARGLVEAGALSVAQDAPGLGAIVDGLLRDPAAVERRGQAGRRYAEAQAEVLPRVMVEVAPWIDASLQSYTEGPR